MPILFLFSCGVTYGEKYSRGNLEIFYTESVNTNYVEGIGDYFESHNLIQAERHSVQITSDPMGSENPGFVLKMILNKDYKVLPKEMEEDLKILESDIKKEVFNGLNFRIEVCDDNFVAIK